MGIVYFLRDHEPAEIACRKLNKLIDRSGQRRELRDRKRFEKPSAKKHHARQRVINRTRKQLEAQSVR